ncbi:MAG: HAMP domain-containing histidine kinase [Cytophagales bacterium]|nr:HAMP domain-containing histidine kinase [Cytophagales bacterium]
MKLLRRTVKNYIIYAALLLVISTPLFYVAIRQLFIREMEEELFHHKHNFEQIVKQLETEKELQLFQLINEEFKLTETSTWPIADSIYNYSRYDSLERKSVPFRALRTGIEFGNKKYELVIRESIVGNTRLVAAIVIIQVTLLVLLLTGFIIINRKLSHEVWDSFYKILDKLKQYKIDEDSFISLPHSTTAEFRDLSNAIVLLVNKSRNAYLDQKEFTENAAHELQTPIAIFRSKLELLMQATALTKEQAELIGHLLDTTDRLAKLNKNLLLLSKIENRQFLTIETVAVGALVDKLLDDYEPLANKRAVHIRKEITHELYLAANPILVEILLSNLLSNALRYATANTEVLIRIDHQTLLVQNQGAPFKSPDKIFNRFNQESRASQGTGLGLAIVKKICEVENFTIVYAFLNSNHQFKVAFSRTSNFIQN